MNSEVLFAVGVLLADAAVLSLVFYGGRRRGWQDLKSEMRAERLLRLELIKERNELKTNLDLAVKRVRLLGLDAKRIFPWLTPVLVLCFWLASCGGGRLVYAQGPGGRLIGTETVYSPDENLEQMDAAEIGLAQKTIDLEAFSLTDQAIVAALADRAAHGVAIRIYLDRGELQAECRGDATCARIPLHALIGLANVQIRVKNSKVLMHLKSYCVDSGMVRGGSANFSEQGERRQDNSATFSVDPESAKAFETKFAAMWARPDNLTVAQAVAGT